MKTCKVFIADRLIASSSATTREKAQVQAYMELYKVFQCTSGQDIMEKFQKAEENLEKGPNVIGFKFKGNTFF